MTEIIDLPHIPREQLVHSFAPDQSVSIPTTQELCQQISLAIAVDRQEKLYPLLARDSTAQAILQLADIPWPRD